MNCAGEMDSGIFGIFCVVGFESGNVLWNLLEVEPEWGGWLFVKSELW